MSRYEHLVRHLSDRFQYVEPADETATVTRRVVMTGAQILGEHWDWWSAKMIEAGKADQLCPLQCMADWVVVHWASRTDREVGEYFEEVPYDADSC